MVYDPEFHARPLDSPGQRLGPLYASRCLCESPPSFHIHCRRSQVSRRVLPEPLVQYARLRARPETDVPDWLHSAVPSELSRPLGRTLCFPRSTVSVWPWKHPDCVGLPIVHVETHHPSQLQVEEASEHAKPEIEPLLGKSCVRKWPLWEGIRPRWPRAVATKLACNVKTKRDGSVKIRLVIDLRRSGVAGSLTSHKRSSLHGH